MGEIWKPVNDLRNYEVSTGGEIRNSNSGKLLSHSIDEQGDDVVYMYEGSKKHKRKVHRLVAETYIDGDLEHSYIKHIDGDKRNNRVENLKLKHKRQGRRIRVLETGEVYDSIRECSRELQVSPSTISKCLNYTFYSNVYGYHFEEV